VYKDFWSFWLFSSRPCGYFLTNTTAHHTLKKSNLLIMKIFCMLQLWEVQNASRCFSLIILHSCNIIYIYLISSWWDFE
jgi:hypothetical protein